MHTNKKQKSSGFLTIVAFVMILFAVGYIFSCLFGSTTLARDTGNFEVQTLDNSGSTNLQMEEDQEKIGDGLEESVALRAISTWNGLVGENDSTSSWTLEVPQKESDNILGENVASGYGDTSTTNTVESNHQLTLANAYILPSVYQDISTSSYQDAITILYSQGILKSNTLFYPHNYVRVSDFIRVVMDAYRVQLGIEPSNLEGLTKNFYITNSSFDEGVLIRVNSAYELGFLQSFELEDAEGNLRLDTFITPQEAKNILSKIQDKNPNLIKKVPSISFESKTTLRKDEMAEIVVSAFGMKLNEGSFAVFSDISGSAYQEEIQLLSKLGIVGGVDGKFFPDAKLENKDFVIMIARTLMSQSDSNPTIENFYYLNKLLNDTSFTTGNATYAPYLEFCLESQACNSLLTQQSQGVSFDANKLLSQGDVTTLLSNVTKNQFIVAGNGKQLITRGEAAKLIVDAFNLKNEKKESTLISQTFNGVVDTASDSENVLSGLWSDFQSFMKIS